MIDQQSREDKVAGMGETWQGRGAAKGAGKPEDDSQKGANGGYGQDFWEIEAAYAAGVSWAAGRL